VGDSNEISSDDLICIEGERSRETNETETHFILLKRTELIALREEKLDEV